MNFVSNLGIVSTIISIAHLISLFVLIFFLIKHIKQKDKYKKALIISAIVYIVLAIIYLTYTNMAVDEIFRYYR